MTVHNDGGEGILKETIERVKAILGEDFQNITVERAVVGVFFTGVKLSNGDGGICFTPIKEIPEAVCCPSSAKIMPTSGKLKGRPAAYFLDGLWAESPMRRALGIAVLNALSSTCWKIKPPSGYEIKMDCDPVDEIDISDKANAVVVGALVPYLRTFMQQGNPLTILELDPRTLKDDERPYWASPEESAERIAQADILIITGTTLINNTLEGLLKDVKPGAEVIVVGPTASMVPDAFFERGVTSIGGIAVTKPDDLLDVLSEAGSGYHFYGKSAERVIIRKLIN